MDANIKYTQSELEIIFANDLKTPQFILLAQIYFKSNDLDRAAKVCEIGLQEHPQNLEARYMLAKIYLLNNQINKSEKFLSKSLNDDLISIKMLKYLLKSYVVGLVTIVLRRDAYERLDKKFDSRFPMCGDFDVIIRLAFSNYFAAVQQPIASYRWHGNNNSKLYNEKHIDELELWYEEMSANINFSTINELLNVKININFLKGKKSVEERDFSSALKYFFLLPFCYHKLKLFAVIILPNFIVRYFSIFKN